ncbi:UvrD-helicase domain-containing protein [uncultured Nocardioides sp.]|uniref:UvrD-helicase domain-containing protein n=2 Tax=uncultured Nocardioides sp. TaxID=198441 RepID=UPI00262D172D|nr:UvrD-helicase domain-containing protein [uncultured Nocardioides sp.]
MSGRMRDFDVTGPLPEQGTTLLEASAGTGKTYTVGALVTRYVAEGRARLGEMLVITFGRAASQELRERVRDALVGAERALADPTSADATDTLVGWLLTQEETERPAMRERLRDALADFDSATIATTHQFCQLVLRSLGVAGDTEAGARLVEDLDDLVVEVVDDLYLGRFASDREPPPFGRDVALELGRAAVGDPQAQVPDAPGASPAGQARVGFARDVRRELDRRKRRLGLLGYDDLLSRLDATLADPAAPARERMRDRWRVVLVDEFQDTDPVQWSVLRRAFHGHATMVLIGDPKQAIYAFRGGDVVTYLAAARDASDRATLGVNRRSDTALVERLQVVLRGAALGDPGIVVHPVGSVHEEPRLVGAPHPSPFRLRRLPRDGFRLRKGLIAAGEARQAVAADCAADIAELLASGATWCGEPLVAEQVAVLVAVRDHGLLVQRELQARGVAAVLAGGGNLLRTPAATEWTTLLEAMTQPHRSGLVRAAALTSFFGHDAATLDARGEQLTGEVADVLRGWTLLVRGRGVAALLEAAEERGLGARVLARVDGERLLTDLRHLGQLLHEAALREQLGLTGVLAWLREESRGSAERPRRLDSDAAAVQIVTVHGSKGLQYPVTYLPFAFQKFPFPSQVARYHEDGERMLDVSGQGEQWSRREALHRSEEAGEELRDLYVALTRAQSQVVTWWAPTANTRHGGLHRLLFGRQPGMAEVPDVQEPREDEYAERVMGLLEQLGGPTAEVVEPADERPAPSRGEQSELGVRTFGREVDTAWRRTSYSGLVRVEEQAPSVGSEPAVTVLTDEPDQDLPDLPDLPAPAAEPDAEPAPPSPVSPMAELPAGAAFGSLVHAVLEHADPDAPDLGAELRARVGEELRWWPVDVDPDVLAAALVPLHHTPLGPLAGDRTLAQVPLRDRLRELDFELPMAGGDHAGEDRPGHLVGEVADLLRTHLPAADPLLPYADRLARPPLADQPLTGYLGGSVDAVLRVGSGADQRFLVVDYKTNLLGEQGRPRTAADYAPPALAEAMLHSHYPLQALLYSVVAHRYLRWRLPAYQPETHLGGVLYLYLRGMCGPDTPTTDGVPAGVFSWRPPAALVTALSDLLDAPAPETARASGEAR